MNTLGSAYPDRNILIYVKVQYQMVLFSSIRYFLVPNGTKWCYKIAVSTSEQPRRYVFGSLWRSLVAKEDDWGSEKCAESIAFDPTEPQEEVQL